jgi:hypothetical protein
MKYRKLRIALSVAWGVVTVLLVVLWLRSYTLFDLVVHRAGVGENFAIWSISGTLYFKIGDERGQQVSYKWERASLQVSELGADNPSDVLRLLRFNILDGNFPGFTGRFHLIFPHWFFVILSAIFAVAPWMWQIVKRFR